MTATTLGLEATPVLTLDGRSWPDGLDRQVTTLVVHQVARRPAQLRVAFASVDVAIRPDTRIGVAVDGQLLFDGAVTRVEQSWGGDGVAMTHVVAHDALDRLRRVRRNRTHHDLDAVELIQALATGEGLQVQSHLTRTLPRLATTAQLGESDLALLHRVATQSGLSVAMRGAVLHVAPIDGFGAPIELRHGHELLDLRIVHSTAAEEVAVDAWEPAAIRDHHHGAGADHSAGWSLEPDAAAHLQRTLAATGAREATAVVATALGDPALQPGTPIQVGAGRARASATITTATHVFDAARGYLTELDTRDPDPAPTPPRGEVGPATVVDLDDPEHHGRVRVELDAHPGAGSAWMPVVAPGAGDGRGLVVLPRVGDRVVVLAPGGDLVRGVVLGGLWDQGPPLDPVAGGEQVRHGLRAQDGSALVIDTEGELVRINDAAGNSFEMSPDRVRLLASTALEIAAPGQVMTLRAARIELEQA